ncbi:MAG TPA: MerR family transcriptional regulator [Polyangiaceae bacterium]|nr:MerR family transcriptional regulator [Polyangiaceae bacterium]
MFDEPDKAVPKYRIGMVARLTGVSTHQLRVWERRYKTVTPARTDGGDRLYSDNDVARLRSLKKLADLGHSIGQVARLSERELSALLEAQPPIVEDTDVSLLAQRVAQQFLECLERLDSLQAERTLSRAAAAFEPEAFTLQVVLPAMTEVGRRWATGEFTIAQEHAASAGLRTQLGVLMRLYAPGVGARVVVCATLPAELHEFGALAAGLLAAGRGWKVVYLGPNLPADQIAGAAGRSQAELILLSIVVEHPGVREQLSRLRAVLPQRVRVILGGAGTRDLDGLPPGLEVMGRLEDLKNVL